MALATQTTASVSVTHNGTCGHLVLYKDDGRLEAVHPTVLTALVSTGFANATQASQVPIAHNMCASTSALAMGCAGLNYNVATVRRGSREKIAHLRSVLSAVQGTGPVSMEFVHVTRDLGGTTARLRIAPITALDTGRARWMAHVRVKMAILARSVTPELASFQTALGMGHA